ncbi:MAG: MucB/RseB C-terminal domain-containing protein [Burkholderiales bacterium]|nr:MucB/RseB C-terminal domain-containing protein [Burkholderiales bacterium]
MTRTRTRPQRWLAGLCLVAGLLAGLLPTASPAADSLPGAAAPADAQAWMLRMRNAASGRNYQGTMTFAASDGLVSSSRVAHFCVGDQVYERIETLDGSPRQVYRHNELVHTVWPQAGLAVIERRTASSALPSALPSARSPVEVDALEQYELSLEGEDRVAGREASVLLLLPRDDLRYAQRLWIDRQSGLMLRADVLAPDRSVLESAGFSSIEIDVRAQPQSVLKPMRQLERLRVLRPEQVVTRLENEGWVISSALPGFHLTVCVKRPAGPAWAAQDRVPRPPGLQAVFSDGLTHISMFIEPDDGTRKLQPVRARFGATHSLSDRKGEFWVTIMGDAPLLTLQRLFDTLERRP